MFGLRFIKIAPTTHVIQYSGGKVVREGAGISFFYYSLTTSLVAVPVGSTDVPFIFEEQTADYQSVSLQGQITYRIAEPKKVAGLMDFTLEPSGRSYRFPTNSPVRTKAILHVDAANKRALSRAT